MNLLFGSEVDQAVTSSEPSEIDESFLFGNSWRKAPMPRDGAVTVTAPCGMVIVAVPDKDMVPMPRVIGIAVVPLLAIENGLVPKGTGVAVPPLARDIVPVPNGMEVKVPPLAIDI